MFPKWTNQILYLLGKSSVLVLDEDDEEDEEETEEDLECLSLSELLSESVVGSWPNVLEKSSPLKQWTRLIEMAELF